VPTRPRRNVGDVVAGRSGFDPRRAGDSWGGGWRTPRAISERAPRSIGARTLGLTWSYRHLSPYAQFPAR
jgi:hypothetical protein